MLLVWPECAMASEGGDTGGPSEPAATNVKTTLLSVGSIQVGYTVGKP